MRGPLPLRRAGIYDPGNPTPKPRPIRWYHEPGGYPRELRLGVLFGLIVAASLLLMGGIVAAVMVGTNHSVHVACLRLHEQTGIETKVARSGADTECYVRIDGQWVPADRWRVIDDSTNYGTSE